MRFLIDESVDLRLVPYLRNLGHDVTAVAQDYPASILDPVVLEIAYEEQRVLVTNDRDFGQLVFRHRQPHAGVIYFRLGTSELNPILARLADLLGRYEHAIDHFIVVTPHRIRARRTT